jgi:chromosome partitioning protein
MGKIIPIVNQKGGVAKTTTAINLSAALALEGKKILLIDMDPQGNASSGLGIETDDLEFSVYDVLINGRKISDTIHKTEVKNLVVLPSNIQLAGAEIELVSMEQREFLLKNALEGIKDFFDYIIIDCPPSLGLLTLNALVAGTSVIIPIQCEYYALEGLSKLINTIELVRSNLNKELEIEGVLMTMFDVRTNLSVQVVDEVKKYFGNKLFKAIVPRNVRISESPSYGKPVILYAPNSKGAEMYFLLGEEVLENG